MIYIVSGGTLNPTHSLTLSFFTTVMVWIGHWSTRATVSGLSVCIELSLATCTFLGNQKQRKELGDRIETCSLDNRWRCAMTDWMSPQMHTGLSCSIISLATKCSVFY